MKCPVCGLGTIAHDEEDEFCSSCGTILNTPAWIKTRYKVQKAQEEQIEFVGQMGVDGVIDGKLPNGEPYEWSKKSRRRLKRPKSSVH